MKPKGLADGVTSLIGAAMPTVTRLIAVGSVMVALTVVASPSEPSSAGGFVFTPTRFDDPIPIIIPVCLDDNCSLREAIRAANAQPDHDTIVLPAGTYSLSQAGAGENDAMTGDLDITDDLVITGSGPGNTIIDGGGIDRVFHVDPFFLHEISVEFNNLTIQNGVSDLGGGIQAWSPLTLNNVNLTNNFATFRGGGLDAHDEVTYNGGTVSGNHAGLDGGGIFFGGVSNTMASVTVSGNEAAPFSDPADLVGGGGVAGGGAAITDSLISGNTTGSQGGGIRGAFNTITNSTITGNFGGEGGGIFTSAGINTVTDSTLSSNQATNGSGGGVYNDSGTLLIDRSTLIGNSATASGGGIKNVATAELINTTVTGNSAIGGGGVDNRATLALTNVTLASNTASTGGGIWAFDATVVNTVFADNATGGDCFITVALTSSHSLDSDGSCGLTGPGDIPNTDPRLGPLANYGGPTETHILRSHSPAIDAGSASACPATDQRGVVRPQDGDDDFLLIPECDIGAFELQPVCGGDGVVESPSDVAIPDSDPGGVNSTVGLIGPGLGKISDLNLCVAIPHTWVGDLIVTLTHVDTGTATTVIDRPGKTNGGFGCSGDDIFVLLDDEAGSPVENECAGQLPSISGNFAPNNPLSVFDGEDLSGDWRLTVSDNAGGDIGVIDRWDLLPQLVPLTPTSTPIDGGTPTPASVTPSPSPTESATTTGSPTVTASPKPSDSATPTVTATPTPTGSPSAADRIWGDNNCKDGVNPVDSLFVLRADAGLPTDTGICPNMGQTIEVLNASPHIWGDVDCTGSMTPVDSLKLLRFDAGLSVSVEDNCPEMASTVTITES